MRTSQMRKVKATYSEFGTARKSVLITCILAETLWQALYLSEFFTDLCNKRPRKKETDKKKNYYHEYMQIFLGGAVVKNLPANVGEAWVQSQGWEDLLEEGMATHSNILA